VYWKSGSRMVFIGRYACSRAFTKLDRARNPQRIASHAAEEGINPVATPTEHAAAATKPIVYQMLIVGGRT